MSKRPAQTLARHRSITLPTTNKQSLFPKGYAEPSRIGSGLTAEVYKCSHHEYGKVCVKIINNSFVKSSLGEKLIANEIKLLEKLSHSHVLKFYETVKHNDKKLIITELCEGGDMEKEIKSKKKFSEKQALDIFGDIVDGCRYLL